MAIMDTHPQARYVRPAARITGEAGTPDELSIQNGNEIEEFLARSLEPLSRLLDPLKRQAQRSGAEARQIDERG
jgi:hypothetical protein